MAMERIVLVGSEAALPAAKRHKKDAGVVQLMLLDVFGRRAMQSFCKAADNAAGIWKDVGCPDICSFLLLRPTGFCRYKVHSLEPDATAESMSEGGVVTLLPLMGPADYEQFFDGCPQACARRPRLLFCDDAAERAHSQMEDWLLAFNDGDPHELFMAFDAVFAAYAKIRSQFWKATSDEARDADEVLDGMQALKAQLEDLQGAASFVRGIPFAGLHEEEQRVHAKLSRFSKAPDRLLREMAGLGKCEICYALIFAGDHYPMTCGCHGRRMFHKKCMMQAVVHWYAQNAEASTAWVCPYCRDPAFRPQPVTPGLMTGPVPMTPPFLEPRTPRTPMAPMTPAPPPPRTPTLPPIV